MDTTGIVQAALAYEAMKAGQQLTQEQIDILKEHWAEVQAIPLPQLQQMVADQLGPSAAGSMTPDQGMRSQQLAALGDVQNIISQGGLDYTDKAKLEEATQSAANQQHRAQAGVAADAAARGQMNSGNRLMLDESAAQAGSNAARSTGLATAAQAQQRRLDAIKEASGMETGLRNQDWSEKESAAQAKDLRDQYNAAARQKAQYYNASIPQQGFDNAMAKATGTGAPTNALAAALGSAATGARADGAGMVGAVGAMGLPKIGGGSSDGSGGGTGGDNSANLYSNANNPYPSDGGGSSPDDWENPYT